MSETTDAARLTGALARTVAGLRAERGWSLDHLAGRSGVSKGVLVALEQGRANPNLATLARIGDAFGVPVTRLLEGADESVVRLSSASDARVLWRGSAGGTGTIIAATPPPWAAELWQWQLEPGEEFGGDAHAPGTRELAWVQLGELAITVAGRQYRLGPGECARFPGDLHHRYANEGSGPITMTMVVVIPPAVG
ncbi:MAG TPA: XRE family transcriptional regulator [Streptosporangiaceae bacterium]|nr:XRE family transcriptional regulator [Streptosporangiaceae bacterium]